MEGGNPTRDAKGYWKNVRRGLLRDKIDRIGLGGYLSLTIPFPDFNDYIEKIADEFRLIREFHTEGKPYVLKPRVAVLTFWGSLRSWTCSGHYHEHPEVDLINVIESLAGMPFDVDFISFDDVKTKGVDNYDVIINAGAARSAWSGYEQWGDEKVVTALTKWAHDGGVFIGINQPSAYEGADTYFRMAHVLGIDEDLGDRICHGKYTYEPTGCGCFVDGAVIGGNSNIYITDADTVVVAEKDGVPALTAHPFGKGKGIYMGGYTHNEFSARTLMNIIINATGGDTAAEKYITDNALCECTYYPAVGKLVVINNSDEKQAATVKTDSGDKSVELDAFDIQILDI
jgi:beta-D-galactosyl-(1->4)-L-rhamnose phosphorylase